MKPYEILRNSRESLNLRHQEIAAFVGISTEHYWDLEMYDEDETLDTLSLIEIVRLCQILRFTPRYLLSCPPALNFRQPEELQLVVSQFCHENKISIEEFGDRAGWEITSFMSEPSRLMSDWNLNCLRDVCSVVGVNFWEFVPN